MWARLSLISVRGGCDTNLYDRALDGLRLTAPLQRKHCATFILLSTMIKSSTLRLFDALTTPWVFRFPFFFLFSSLLSRCLLVVLFAHESLPPVEHDGRALDHAKHGDP